MKINKKIILSFLFVIIVINIISLGFMNFLTHSSFTNYLETESEYKVREIKNNIKENFRKTANNSVLFDELNRYSNIENIFIQIQKDNNIIFSSDQNYLNYHGMGMQMMKKETNKKYQEKKYDITVDGVNLRIAIGQYKSQNMSTSARIFMNQINQAHIFSFILSLIVGVIVATIISRQMSRPIMALNRNLERIARGYYDNDDELHSNIYEINQLNLSSKQIKRSLKNQDEIRQKMIEDLSHDLRTPLTVLKTNIEAMSDKVIDVDKDGLDILSNRLDRVISIVKQLDNLNDIGNQNMKKVHLDISKETNNIIGLFEQEATHKNIKILKDIDYNIILKINVDTYNQILLNLLSNAIKYNKNFGRVMVTLKQKDANIILKVEDTGIGIGKNDLEFIFDRFYRCDESRTDSNVSSGIGLSIVKSLVESNNAEIKVESQIKVGTKIEIIFKKVEVEGR